MHGLTRIKNIKKNIGSLREKDHMVPMKNELRHRDLTDKIINLFYRVYNTLGYGFLEKNYQKALMIEFRRSGITASSQAPIKVYYANEVIGEYFADIVVEDKVIVEIKAAKALIRDNEAQLLNYLKATNMEVGLLLNFGPKPEIRRKIFDNNKK